MEKTDNRKVGERAAEREKTNKSNKWGVLVGRGWGLEQDKTKTKSARTWKKVKILTRLRRYLGIFFSFEEAYSLFLHLMMMMMMMMMTM